MRIGFVNTSLGNFGKKGFYNSQEIGLSKELSKLVDKIIIYKPVSQEEEKTELSIDGCQNVTLKYIPAKSIGTNAILDCNELDEYLDAIIYFCDTQLHVPVVGTWCQKHGIKIFPYIGVTESHSTNKLKKSIVNFLFERNLKIYKKCHCFAKTPVVKTNLLNQGVKYCTVTPVGLDVSILNGAFREITKEEIRNKWGYSKADNILLFIGRMTAEKQPVRMIEIFEKLLEKKPNSKLIMVGTGELLDAVKECAKGFPVQFIDRIPNSQIWELYRMADTFVNLNEQEIFGMAILEAMFYGCKTVAWHAPGPDYIIRDGKTGDLADSNDNLLKKLINDADYSVAAYDSVVNEFTWESTARKMYDIVKEEIK